MKFIYIAAILATLQLFSRIGAQAQTTGHRLNQVELMKQFLGSWQTELARDTIQIGEFTAFGNAVVGNITNSTKGKILQSVKELWGYDKKTDKMIFAEISDSSPEIQLFAFWFTTENSCQGVPYQDISNPEKAALKYRMEIKSSDIWVMTMLQNNREEIELTFNRVKK